MHDGDAAAQARTALGIALDALARVGMGPSDVVQTRLYVRHARDTDAVGKAHAEVLGSTRPAATMIVVNGFVDPLMLVEVELVAHEPSHGEPSHGEPSHGRATEPATASPEHGGPQRHVSRFACSRSSSWNTRRRTSSGSRPRSR